MSESAKGILALILACTVWGLSPLFYAQVRHVPPMDVLCYRGLWSLVFFLLILLFQGRLAVVGRVLMDRKVLPLILIGALMISANWFGFIFAISVGKTIESSLGYYIFPMVAVLIGWVAFGERLQGAQRPAVMIAAAAVALLTYGLGVPPWIGLGLAVTFGIYGLIKKRVDLGPVVSVTAEVAVFAPFALLWLATKGSVPVQATTTHALLALAGPLTATPLILFSYAARRVRLSTVGVVQFLNPTLQFSCAVFVFSEVFTKWHAVAFPLIWIAVALYAFSTIYADRAARREVARAATSSTTVT